MIARRWGRIINLGSIHGMSGGRPGLASYSSAKAGVEGFTKAASLELAPHGVTVNCVIPGYTRTPMFRCKFGVGREDGVSDPYRSSCRECRYSPCDCFYRVEKCVSYYRNKREGGRRTILLLFRTCSIPGIVSHFRLSTDVNLTGEEKLKRQRINLPKSEGHGCFACGTGNPNGLNLNFYRLGDCICTEISLSKNHEGWEGMAHGGIISTLLEETMSWAILFFRRAFFLTRGTTIKYIRSVMIKAPLIISAKVLDESAFPRS